MSQPCACLACEAGYYQDAANNDTSCKQCTALSCDDNQYYAECGVGSIADASCVTCKGCGAGTGLASMCTADTDTVCTACLINQEQSENNWYGACF